MKPSLEAQSLSPLYIGSVFESNTLKTLLNTHDAHRVMLITDETIYGLYQHTLATYFDHAVEYITIPAGEMHKTRETKAWIEDQLLSRGVGRDTCLIALGGGVITDLVGFVAATYCRGIPVIYIPTTLLGMTDAAIGGKTGVNTPLGKNMIGTVTQPIATLIDPEFLNTLPEHTYRHALAETLKHALIGDAALFDWLLEHQSDILQKNQTALLWMITRSIELKLQCCGEDPFEAGKRALLNFGHTIGHALETASNYQLPHGLAVMLGMQAEAHISMRMGYLDAAVYQLLHTQLDTFISDSLTDLNWTMPPLAYLKRVLLQDKKVKAGQINMVLLRDIGVPVVIENQYTHPVPDDSVMSALKLLYPRLPTTQLVGVVTASNPEALLRCVQAAPDEIQCVELRLDYCDHIDIPALTKVFQQIKKPSILTLRHETQGGRFKGSESERLALLTRLARLKPTYIDIEYDVPDAWITAFATRHPECLLIRSYHDFEQTPERLEDVLAQMQHPNCSYYKVVTTAQTSLDTLRVLQFLKQHGAPHVTAHAMGALGVPTRILGAALGNAFTYVALEDSPAPGCLSAKEMIHLYRTHQLNRNTAWYGLLGDPVEQSVGHQFHNDYFKHEGLNAVYVKWCVPPENLNTFFEGIQALPFKGFSVTMPLKKCVLATGTQPDAMTESIGACNTLKAVNGVWYGTNTDGVGAVKALESCVDLHNKTVLILGAGGAAAAIAHTLATRPLKQLGILNRSQAHAQKLAENVQTMYTNCAVSAIDGMAYQDIDILISTLPPHAVTDMLRVYSLQLNSHATVLDINYYNQNKALKTLCDSVSGTWCDGRQMFEQQAKAQLGTWFSD